MKNEVLQFLRNQPKSNTEKFNKAFEFLRAAKGTNFNQMRVYNMQGATESNIKNIIYDLKKHYGISDAEVLSKKAPAVPKVVLEGMELQSVTDVNLSLDKKDNATENTENQKKTDLHKEFPFLSAKDCPAEMHIVTGLLVASWKRYNQLHTDLQKALSGEIEKTEAEIQELTADTAKEFEMNDKFYKELVHYRDNNTVLGEIDALKEFKINEEIKAMSTADLVKEQKNAASYLSKRKKELKQEGLSEEEKVLLERRIADREFRLALVNKKLGM